MQPTTLRSLLLALCLSTGAPLALAATDIIDQPAPGSQPHDNGHMNGQGERAARAPRLTAWVRARAARMTMAPTAPAAMAPPRVRVAVAARVPVPAVAAGPEAAAAVRAARVAVAQVREAEALGTWRDDTFRRWLGAGAPA